CDIQTAQSAKEALGVLAGQSFDLVLADIKMPEIDGFELLELLKRDHPQITVVMMTAYGGIDMAVKAMRKGAYDFITKPFDHETMVVRLDKALERSSLIQENYRLQMECQDSRDVFQELVGNSKVMNRLYETIQMVAKSDLTVLITGESGTGKELVARAVHNLSNRSNNAFVAVNCPTLPETILESELFGYKKGAFTQATQDNSGLFQEAHKGTIFLDEIGDITPAIQTKLLRVLQEKEIKPLGDTKSITVDVRIIASTNQNLEDKIKKGEFRDDVYYRLNVLPVKLPALREHPEDIPLIANHLLEKHCAELDKPLKKISPELMDLFLKRRWEGNVRELENIIMQGILFSTTDEIQIRDIHLNTNRHTRGPIESASNELPYKIAKEQTLRDFNHAYLSNLLTSNRGNVSRAARQCGMERQALQQIMRRYQIKADDFRK
ncbi:MAG: sigma-54-dependent Fis family transcriptional regulator, partial [Deltaproteobacteria bacterium]|nr:sigma-54-dependent Fis family transcriptional regulator [Deltaproteobacteria bacterium]